MHAFTHVATVNHIVTSYTYNYATIAIHAPCGRIIAMSLCVAIHIAIATLLSNKYLIFRIYRPVAIKIHYSNLQSS